MTVPTISEVTRRAAFDFLTNSGVCWSGRLSEDEFLSRLYDLGTLPSTDGRHENAAADVFQHRVNNCDWPEDWVFYDSRFGLLQGPDEEFVRFLCETVHPVVRPDQGQVSKIVRSYNAFLNVDGWSIVEKGEMSGRPVFQGVRRDTRVEVFAGPTGWEKVDRQLHEAKERLGAASSEEHWQAVGLMCREALISVAEQVFDPVQHRPNDGVEISKTDARRMLEVFFERTLTGSANDEARGHAKAALKLAVALQHKRTADFRMAALCCEATTSVVNIVAIVSGRRDQVGLWHAV